MENTKSATLTVNMTDFIGGKPRKPNGDDISWAANPWGVAYTFEPVFKNIDEVSNEDA